MAKLYPMSVNCTSVATGAAAIVKTVPLHTMRSVHYGMLGSAACGKEKLLCKVFNEQVLPRNNGALDEETIARNQARFDAFTRRRTRLLQQVNAAAGAGDGIICPAYTGVHEDHWAEFVPLVEDPIPYTMENLVLGAMPDPQKVGLLKRLTVLVARLHAHGVVHCCLQPQQVLLVGELTDILPKLADFEDACLEDEIPLELGGDVSWYSPEQAAYLAADPDERDPGYITTASDIFTLGLLFHWYMTGEQPRLHGLPEPLRSRQRAGKFVYVWEAALCGVEGCVVPYPTMGDGLAELIGQMLDPDPNARPTAEQVLERLNHL